MKGDIQYAPPTDLVGTVTGSITISNDHAVAEAIHQEVARHLPFVKHQSVMPFAGIPESFKYHIDYSDNDAQKAVLKHHYEKEFGRGDWTHAEEEEVLKDFREDSVVHELINDQPTTYHGRSGVRQAVEHVRSLLQDDDEKTENKNEKKEPTKIDLQHIAVNHNHAQVIWKAETPSHRKIVGTDSFFFDDNNRIAAQTIVALSEDTTAAAEKEKH
jgi:hypothetical protein